MPSRFVVSPPPVWLPIQFPRPVPFVTTKVYALPPIELPYGQKKPARRCRDDPTGSTHRSPRSRRRDRLEVCIYVRQNPLPNYLRARARFNVLGKTETERRQRKRYQLV
jgi:hypothetical protein